MAMNPMGGIDQQITQRAARLKNDPNALMQQYGQSKNILDLIAAQRAAEKVQKEKQLAALQMQGNPPTVADQLEQTLIASEKEKMAPDLAGMKNLRDRTKGVAGVLAQKQQQQQKRMQQMGQQPQRPQGLPSQPAPNLNRMYNGGIVGFEEGVYIPTEEDIDAVIRERGLRSATRESVRNMLIREQKLAKQREAVGGFFSGIGERALRQRAARQEAIGEAPARGIRPTRPEEVIETESVTEVMPTGGVDLAAQRRAQDLTDAVNAEQRQMAAAREPDVAAAAVEEIEEVKAPPSIQEQMDAALAPAQPEGMMFEPEVMQAGRQQAADKAAKEQFGRNAASLGLGGMSIRPLEKMTQAPEMLRRRPTEPERKRTPQELLNERLTAEFDKLSKQEAELEDTRSTGRKILDRLARGAVRAAEGPAAATSRGALASLGAGISRGVEEERQTRKQGLEAIAKRRADMLKLGADISQSERGLDIQQQRADTLGEQLAQEQAQFDRKMESQSEQFQRTMKLKENELASSNALNVIKAQNKANYDAAMLDIKGAELEAQVAFNDARTQQGNQTLQLRAADALGKYSSKLQEVQREAIDALSFNPQYKNNPDALKAAEKAIRLEFKTLIDAKKAEFAALGAGSSGLSESSEAALASLGI
jgi:hypothetical protein